MYDNGIYKLDPDKYVYPDFQHSLTFKLRTIRNYFSWHELITISQALQEIPNDLIIVILRDWLNVVKVYNSNKLHIDTRGSIKSAKSRGHKVQKLLKLGFYGLRLAYY